MQEHSPFTRILVAADGSETSVRAGRLAIQIASLHGSQVTLVYVVDSIIVEEMAGATSKSVEIIQREMEEKGQRYLHYLARLAREKDVEPEQVILSGTPYWVIADLAREQRADLIVVGRVGSRGARCAPIGSVAERVLEFADCPVLVVSGSSGLGRSPVKR